jgi:hypothetical protein
LDDKFISFEMELQPLPQPHIAREEFAAASTALGQMAKSSAAILALQQGSPEDYVRAGVEARAAMPMLGRGEIVVMLPLLLLSLPLGVLMVLGGYKMRRLELYGLVLVAAIVIHRQPAYRNLGARRAAQSRGEGGLCHQARVRRSGD